MDLAVERGAHQAHQVAPLVALVDVAGLLEVLAQSDAHLPREIVCTHEGVEGVEGLAEPPPVRLQHGGWSGGVRLVRGHLG